MRNIFSKFSFLKSLNSSRSKEFDKMPSAYEEVWNGTTATSSVGLSTSFSFLPVFESILDILLFYLYSSLNKFFVSPYLT